MSSRHTIRTQIPSGSDCYSGFVTMYCGYFVGTSFKSDHQEFGSPSLMHWCSENDSDTAASFENAEKRGAYMFSLYKIKMPLKSALGALTSHSNAKVVRCACTVLGTSGRGNEDLNGAKNTRLWGKYKNSSDKGLDPFGKEMNEAFQRLSNAVRMGLNPTVSSEVLSMHAFKDC